MWHSRANSPFEMNILKQCKCCSTTPCHLSWYLIGTILSSFWDKKLDNSRSMAPQHRFGFCGGYSDGPSWSVTTTAPQPQTGGTDSRAMTSGAVTSNGNALPLITRSRESGQPDRRRLIRRESTMQTDETYDTTNWQSHTQRAKYIEL